MSAGLAPHLDETDAQAAFLESTVLALGALSAQLTELEECVSQSLIDHPEFGQTGGLQQLDLVRQTVDELLRLFQCVAGSQSIAMGRSDFELIYARIRIAALRDIFLGTEQPFVLPHTNQGPELFDVPAKGGG